MDVSVEAPEEMNLLGLFMKAALEARTAAIERARPKGEIALSAGEMSVTLDFGPERVLIRKGAPARPRAHVKGSLEALIGVARGQNGPLLRRQAKVSGNPLALLPLAKVFKAKAETKRPAA